MLIGVMSDTHDDVEGLQRAVAEFKKQQVELVIHCGDWVAPFMVKFCKDLQCKIISVFGNNEGNKMNFLSQKEEFSWNIEFEDVCAQREIDGKQIAIYHGTDRMLLDSLLSCGKYDVVFSGHTHTALIEKSIKTLHVNPGSSSRLGREMSSVAIYDTKTDEAEIISLSQEALF